MASENLELVRSIYAAWERDDYGSTDWADPEIEFVLGDGPDPGTSTGVAAMTEAWRGILRNWEGYGLEVEEFRELDASRILVLIRLRGRGKTSGLDIRELGAEGANLVELHDGKGTRIVLYFDRDRALSDLGLG